MQIPPVIAGDHITEPCSGRPSVGGRCLHGCFCQFARGRLRWLRQSRGCGNDGWGGLGHCFCFRRDVVRLFNRLHRLRRCRSRAAGCDGGRLKCRQTCRFKCRIKWRCCLQRALGSFGWCRCRLGGRRRQHGGGFQNAGEQGFGHAGQRLKFRQLLAQPRQHQDVQNGHQQPQQQQAR